MARFTAAGTYSVQITGALLADARFNNDPNAFDVCLEVKHLESGAEDVWRGEFSNGYGRGKVAHKKQRELTVESLQKIGWQSGEDFSQLPALVGMEIQVGVVESVTDKGTYYNVRYLGGGNAEKPEAITDFAQRMANLNSGGFAAQPAPPMPQGGFAQPQMAQQPAPAPAPQAPPAQMPMPGMPQAPQQ